MTKKLMGLAMAIALLFMLQGGYAEAADYRFDPLEQTVHAGEKVPVPLRLVAVKTGKPVAGAALAEPKLIMIMPGMEDMDGHAVKAPAQADGTYRVLADLVAPGAWVLTVTAQVAGEKEPVTGTVKLTVVP